MSPSPAAHSPSRTWLPALVMVLSLAFQTGCKNRKTVINQAAQAPANPTVTSGTSTSSAGPVDSQQDPCADPDDPACQDCDPADPSCDSGSQEPAEETTCPLDPAMMGAGPNVTINIVNNGVIQVVDRGQRRRRRRGPRWRHREGVELMGDEGGHGDEGLPGVDTDLGSDAGDAGDCSDGDGEAEAEDRGTGCEDDGDDPVETETETQLVDLEASLERARQAVADAEAMRDEAEAAARKAGELADQMASLTDLTEAEAVLAQVIEQSTLAGKKSEAVAEKLGAIGAGIDEVEASGEQEGKEPALTEARRLWEQAEAASKATDEHQEAAEAAEARAQAKVDALSEAADEDDDDDDADEDADTDAETEARPNTD